jgi:hypothetical protein
MLRKAAKAICHLPLAFGLSLIAFALAVVLQGAILFPRAVVRSVHEDIATVRRLALASDGRRAVVLQMRAPIWSLGGFTTGLTVCDTTRPAQGGAGLSFEFTPRLAAQAGNRLFVSSLSGAVYATDIDELDQPLCHLGTHAAGLLFFLECSPDGAYVVGSNRDLTTAWRRQAPHELWSRADLDVYSACFDARSERLFCGVNGGGVQELDIQTGATLRRTGTHCIDPVAIDVSPDAALLGTMSGLGEYVVSRVADGQPLWSMSFPMPAAAPKFTPDGRYVLAPPTSREGVLLVVAAESGELVAALRGAKAELAGIGASDSGLVYAWDHTGTFTAWELVSHRVVRQMRLPCSFRSTGSS